MLILNHGTRSYSLKGDIIMYKYDELKELGFRFDHSASERGYISRKIDYKIVPYIGRFGIGVKVINPRYDTTQYVDIEYYILDVGKLYVYSREMEFVKTIPYNCFKNGKRSYKVAFDDCNYIISKDLYNIRLKEWDYLCD